MGKFIYDGTVSLEVEDRALAHLQAVISTKLRRGEPMFFTWREDASVGDGRTSVWLHPGASLVFRFYGSRRPALNPAWIDALASAANSPSGLRVLSEPQDAPATSTAPATA